MVAAMLVTTMVLPSINVTVDPSDEICIITAVLCYDVSVHNCAISIAYALSSVLVI